MNSRQLVWRSGKLSAALSVAAIFVVSFLLAPAAQAQVTLQRLSTDPFTNPTSQHATQVEPDTFSFGSTIVAAFQSGRFFDGGSSDIGFATSTDGGMTWTHGFLPGITKIQGSGNPYDRVSDPSVAYDPLHGVWLIASLPIVDTLTAIPAVIVSRSTDGINWENPIAVTGNVASSDKDWIVCDTWSSSPFYGNCYVEWDDPGNGDLINMSTSTDGGLTWGPALHPANNASGIGGQPVVQPNGTVVVPIESAISNNIVVFGSKDGGSSWTSTVNVSSIIDHLDAGNLRSSPLPSAAGDGGGTVYVVWQDCRFRTSCQSNDIVLSTSNNGVKWTAPSRIPVDPTTSTVDHFIPGIDADKTTSGTSAHLAVTFYGYSQSNCIASTCRLYVGFISSDNGGATWSARTVLAGPMNLSWLPNTTLGRMVGDYISTSYVNGKAFGVFAVAHANNGTVLDEAMYTTTSGLSVEEGGPRFSSAGEEPVPNAKSDHGPRPQRREREPYTQPASSKSGSGT